MLSWKDAPKGSYERLISLKTFSGDLARPSSDVLRYRLFMKRRLDGSLADSLDLRSSRQHYLAFPRVIDLIACMTIFTEELA